MTTAPQSTKLNQTTQLAALVVAGLLLRLLRLGGKSIWLDEALSLSVAQRGMERFWSAQSEWNHPPAYFWALEQWAAFGESEFWLRLPSALFGSASIWLVYLLAQRLFPQRNVGLTAALLTAFSPMLLWYSQEARMYAPLSFMGLVVVVCTVRHMLQPKQTVWFMVWALCAILMLYTHYFAALILVVQIAAWGMLWLQKRVSFVPLISLSAGWVVAFACFVPWLRSDTFALFVQRAQAGETYLSGLLLGRLGIAPSPLLLMGLVVLGAIVAVGFAVWGFGRIPAATLNTLINQNGLRWIIAIGVVLLFAAETVPRVYTLKRQLVLFWPYLFIGVAAVLNWAQRNRLQLMLMGAAGVMLTLWVVLAVPKDDWRQVSAEITANLQPGDVVVVTPDYMEFPLDYYLDDGIEILPEPLSNSVLNIDRFQQHPRIWLVQYRPEADPAQLLQTSIDSFGEVQRTYIDDTIFAELYIIDSP